MAYITDSWSTIERNCRLGKAKELYALGDLKTLTFTVDGVQETVDMEIIDFDHDDLPNGNKATITFFSKQLLSQYKKMNNDNQNSGGWAGSYSLRSWCNVDLFNALPSDLQTVIKSVKKLSDGGQYSTSLVETTDKVWFASISEIAYDSAITTLGGQGSKYALVDQSGSSWRIKNKSDGTAYYWWSRSATTDTWKWGYASQWGGFSYDNAANAFGIAFGFCIGESTDTTYDEKYVVETEWIIDVATEVRRLTGTQNNLTTDQILDALKTL